MKSNYNYAIIYREAKAIILTDEKPSFSPIASELVEAVKVTNASMSDHKLGALCITGDLRCYDFITDSDYDISDYDETSYKHKWFTKKPYLYGWSLRKRRSSYDLKLFNISIIEITNNGTVGIHWN